MFKNPQQQGHKLWLKYKKKGRKKDILVNLSLYNVKGTKTFIAGFEGAAKIGKIAIYRFLMSLPALGLL